MSGIQLPNVIKWNTSVLALVIYLPRMASNNQLINWLIHNLNFWLVDPIEKFQALIAVNSYDQLQRGRKLNALFSGQRLWKLFPFSVEIL